MMLRENNTNIRNESRGPRHRRTESGVREENWADFHKRHHSQSFHFSCANERIFRNGNGCNPHQLCAFLFDCNGNEVEGEVKNGWFTNLFGPSRMARKVDTLTATHERNVQKRILRNMVLEDGIIQDDMSVRDGSIASSRPWTPSQQRRRLGLRKISRGKPIGNIKIDSIKR